MASSYDLTNDQETEFKRSLVAAGLSAEDVQRVIKYPHLASQMVEASRPSATPRLPSWYVDPEHQIDAVNKWLKSNGSGLGPVTGVIPPVPDFIPLTSSEVLMLAVYLPRKYNSGVSNFKRTFRAWWESITLPHGFWYKYRHDFTTYVDQLELMPGIKHYAGIRWVGFDPRADQGRSTVSVWANRDMVTRPAGVEVLTAASLFPRWVTAWNGMDVPYPRMAGFRFVAPVYRFSSDRLPTRPEEWQVPCMYRWDDDRIVNLHFDLSTAANEQWAAPRVRDL